MNKFSTLDMDKEEKLTIHWLKVRSSESLIISVVAVAVSVLQFENVRL